MAIITRAPLSTESLGSGLLKPEEGYVISDGNRLDSVIEDLSKVLDKYDLQLEDIDFQCSDFVFRIVPKSFPEKPNTWSDEELKKFAEFIADGVELNGLLEQYTEEVVERLFALTDEELAREKEFYEYK